MKNLTHVVDCVYTFLATQGHNHTLPSELQRIADTIKTDYDCFFLHSTLDAVDVDLFILFYMKYLNKRYPEFQSNEFINLFVNLKENIFKVAKLLDGAAMQFVGFEETNDNFVKGFLFSD